MIKITLKHYDSIVRAETALFEKFDPKASALVRHEFDNDSVRIHELKALILHIIYNPDLPYGPADTNSDNSKRE